MSDKGDKSVKEAAEPKSELATVHTDREGQISNTTENKFGNAVSSGVNISSGNIGGSAMYVITHSNMVAKCYSSSSKQLRNCCI